MARTRLVAIYILLVAIGISAAGLIYLANSSKPLRGEGGAALPVYLGELALPKGEHFNRPLGIAAAEGALVVADSANNRVVVFDARGRWQRAFGAPGAGVDQFDYPVAVAVDAGRNRIYVADLNNRRVSVWSRAGEYRYLLPLAAERERVGVIRPVALALDKQGYLYVVDVERQRVLVFDTDGKYRLEFGFPGAGEGQLAYANGLMVSPDGETVYVADTNNGRVQLFSREGRFQGSFSQVEGTAMVTPRGLGLDPRREVLYLADTVTHRVLTYQLRSGRGGSFGTMGSGRGQFKFPNGIAVDPKGRIYIADRDNNRIVVYGYPEP